MRKVAEHILQIIDHVIAILLAQMILLMLLAFLNLPGADVQAHVTYKPTAKASVSVN